MFQNVPFYVSRLYFRDYQIYEKSVSFEKMNEIKNENENFILQQAKLGLLSFLCHLTCAT